MTDFVKCPRCNGGRRIRLDDQMGINTPCALCVGKLEISIALDTAYRLLAHGREHVSGSEVEHIRGALND